MRLLRIVTLVGLLVLAVAAAADGAGSPPRAHAGATSPAGADTFVSLVPACGCARRTALDVFSAVTGKRLSTLSAVALPADAHVDAAADHDGRVLVTASTDARCAVTGKYMECPKIAPNSCTNKATFYGPQPGWSATAFSEPGTREIGAAVPSPDGREVAFASASCTGAAGMTGIFIRDLATGAQRAVVSSPNQCDSYGRPSWSADGRRLAFAYQQAHGPIRRMGGAGTVCPTGATRLAVAQLGGGTTAIGSDRGCAWRSAAFDRSGIAVAEGCAAGSPHGATANNTGHAYLVQFNDALHRTHTVALKLGLEQALVATTASGGVLVTQDQPANNGTPEDDWVWAFNGAHLHAIAHYRAHDGAQVIAVPR